jgi:hypothetical protein
MLIKNGMYQNFIISIYSKEIKLDLMIIVEKVEEINYN